MQEVRAERLRRFRELSYLLPMASRSEVDS
jgi:hypothetical protein